MSITLKHCEISQRIMRRLITARAKTYTERKAWEKKGGSRAVENLNGQASGLSQAMKIVSEEFK